MQLKFAKIDAKRWSYLKTMKYIKDKKGKKESKTVKIGIDIDNTLTDIQKEMNIAAYNYAKQLGKEISKTENLLEEINNNGEFYKQKFKFSYDELKYFLKNIQEEIIRKAKPRTGAVETIKKLREDGHTVYIVTARVSEFHDDPYTLSKTWLDNNKIEYDKLIVNAREKAPICKEEKIDIFIDDQLNNCLTISNEGVKVIRVTTDNTKYDKIINCNNWEHIYNLIKEMK